MVITAAANFSSGVYMIARVVKVSICSGLCTMKTNTIKKIYHKSHSEEAYTFNNFSNGALTIFLVIIINENVLFCNIKKDPMVKRSYKNNLLS